MVKSAVYTGSTYTLTGVTPTNNAVAVEFIQAFTITPTAGAGGSISPNSAIPANAGTQPVFTAIPDAGFVVDSWLVDGTIVQSGGDTYTFPPVKANHTVTVTFKT